MARTDNLTNFLTDVASAIKKKKGTTDLIQPKDFDTEIQSISSGAISNLILDISSADISTNAIKELFEAIVTLQTITFKDVVINRNNFLKYTLLDYIQSTGTQYIDTGYYANNGMVCYSKCMLLERGKYIIGSHDPSSPYNRNGFMITSSDRWELGYGNDFISTNLGAPALNTVFDVTFSTISNEGYLEINGSKIITSSGQTLAPKTTVRLFGHSYDQGSGRIYSANIKDSELNEIFNFIPVLDYTGTPCLYDTVTEKYYYNQGTGEFITGPIVIDSNEINNGVVEVNLSQSSINNKTIDDLFARYQEVKQINFNDTQLTREEFYNYTEVEYLETTKTQYIDTKIKYNDNYKIGIDFLVKDTDVNDSVICGSKDWGGNSNILTIEYGYILRNYYPSSPVDYSFAQNQRKQIEIFRGQIICDNIVQVGNDDINPSAEEKAANIHIFSDNNGGHLINYAKLYSFYIYDTTTNSYVMNAFPVLDGLGTPCLYDAVTKKYYYNQGTGDFLFA